MTKQFENILVISMQGMGDLLLATPLLHGLKTVYPASNVTVLTFESNKDILDKNKDVDRIVAFKSIDTRNIRKVFRLAKTIRDAHFDLTICAYPSGLRSAFIAYISGAGERLGQGLSLFKGYRWLFTRQVPITGVKHAALMNMDFLTILGVEIKSLNLDPVYRVSDEDLEFAKNFLRSNNVSGADPVIAIHAGGGKFTASYRNWPQERFARAADILAEKFNAKIIFVGGKDDGQIVNSIAGMMAHKPVAAAGKMSLAQTAALLTKTRLLLCNNSGPMHIAAALNVRTVSIFGSADPRIHRPWGKGHVVLQNQLECSPCYYPFFRDTLEETKQKNSWVGKKFKCKTGDYRCLTSVTVDQVVEAAGHIIKGD